MAETGSCGTHRFVAYSDGYWGFTEYFDGSGAMIAATSWSDIAPRTDHGAVPPCRPVAAQRFCTHDSGP
jgi:hypothetical protein